MKNGTGALAVAEWNAFHLLAVAICLLPLGADEGYVGEVGAIAGNIPGEEGNAPGRSMGINEKIRQRHGFFAASLAIGFECLRS